MDRNTIIGFILLIVLFIAWQYTTAPTAEQLAEQKRIQDSLAMVEAAAEEANAETSTKTITEEVFEADTTLTNASPEEQDSIMQLRMNNEFGAFSAAAVGEEKTEKLQNNVFTVYFSTKGGAVQQVVLADYYKVDEEENKSEIILLEDEKDKFEYVLPVSGVAGGMIRTSDLFFDVAEKTENSITLRANVGQGRYFEQKYTIEDSDSYKIAYSVTLEGLQGVLSNEEFSLHWLNYLDKLELNTRYERMYSSTYYKLGDDSPTYLSLTSNDEETSKEKTVKWVSHSNQFFTSSLLAKDKFLGGEFSVEVMEEDDIDLKRLETNLVFPYNKNRSETFDMEFYLGPKEFKRLRAFGENMEDVIPFGWSVFGTINRWIVRPIFNFLSTFIGSKGIVILFLTILIKLALYPLTYKMLYSQSKMSALKPELEKVKEKHKDDSQKQSMEQMKMYREFGVNPLGGCLPIVLQMPIWFALYRFFPAAIEFRQAPFLWATDLSSYDVIARLPFEIPLGFGSHISLFTVLWAITTLIYTYYNSKHMDMSANPAMKYMQYIMPVMFLGFFNSYASGLTAYLFFSNLINITQTLVTKNYIIDKDKILKELRKNKEKPKKKGKFQQRLQEMLEEQRKIQEKQQAQKKKKK
ncbi:MAG: membrane protein insertase YidC [Bacteroidota bacterium]